MKPLLHVGKYVCVCHIFKIFVYVYKIIAGYVINELIFQWSVLPKGNTHHTIGQSPSPRI